MRWFDGRRAILLPLCGAAMGAIGAFFYAELPIPFAALLIAVTWSALAFVPRESERFGIADAVNMAAAAAVRWLAIEHLATGRALTIFIAAQAVPRAAMIVLAWVSRPAPAGAGYAFSSTLETWMALIAMAAGFAAAFACGLRPAAMILAGAYLIGRLVQWISYRVRGAVNADSFGAAQLLTELYVLLLFDCAACKW